MPDKEEEPPITSMQDNDNQHGSFDGNSDSRANNAGNADKEEEAVASNQEDDDCHNNFNDNYE